jgi:hypothetical protein
MDIHLPKVPHGWRELGREIGIIVIGVLIALFFEQLAQAWDWHEKVHAADKAMRLELLSDDGPEIYTDAALHPCVVARLDAIRSAVESNAPRAEVRHQIDGLWIPFVTYDSTAYGTAEASEVGLHFDPDRLAPFTTVYASMPILNEAAVVMARDKAQLKSLRRTGGPLSSAEADRVLSTVEALRNDIDTMWGGARFLLPDILSLGKLDARFVNASMNAARRQYGTCIKPLPADFPANLPPYE